jgi:diguanylate cyclase
VANPQLSNPSEIARETLRVLASRRLAPTPENYQKIYAEISGGGAPAAVHPEQVLAKIAESFPRHGGEQSRVAAQLERATTDRDWKRFQMVLQKFLSEEAAVPPPSAWSQLLNDLFKQWQVAHGNLPPERKREQLERALAGGNDPEECFPRLQALARNWAEQPLKKAEETAPPPAATKLTAPPLSAGQVEAIRDLLAFTLESAIAANHLSDPELDRDAKVLVETVRAADSAEALVKLKTTLRNFWFKLEIRRGDDAELQETLRRLLHLLIENIAELVGDEKWLKGQITLIRQVVESPLDMRALEDAEKKLKEIIYKQGVLKTSLGDAKAALKNMLAAFIDRLSEMSETAGGYHDKVAQCAERVAKADDITQLQGVLGEVMSATRDVQSAMLRSRDELQASKKRVEETEHKVAELEAELQQLSNRMQEDALTGTLNRRGLDSAFEREAARADRRRSGMCVALLDIDNFKKLNDTYGHQTGDDALVHLAQLVQRNIRPHDSLARYGGEEFVILLPDTGIDEASMVLTRLQRELTKEFFLHGSDKLLITFSAGVAVRQAGETQAQVLERSDKALYAAKAAGKNRVTNAD